MLKAMDELERSVNDLLDRIRERTVRLDGSGTRRPADPGEGLEPKDREAVELIRRAVKRLKSI